MISPNLLSWSIPFKYSVVTRLSPLQDRVSWVLIQHLPILYLVAVGGQVADLPARCVVAALAMICMQTFYEMGYIQNDVLTTRSEAAPTLRLPAPLLEFGANNFASIIVIRVAIGSALLAAFLTLAWLSETAVNAALFATVLLATMMAFHLHNSTRSRWNVATYFLLASGRYGAVPVLLAPEGLVVIYALISVLMVPLVRTLEHACKPKYGLATLSMVMIPFEKSRVIYYLAASVTYFSVTPSTPQLLLPGFVLVYLLVYRCAVLFVVSRKMVQPTKHQAYDRSHGEDRE